MTYSLTKSAIAYPEILISLQLILKNAHFIIDKCDKPFEHYSISELNLSAENMAYFIDAINQQFSLVLSKKDFSTIRSIKALTKTIEMILSC